MNLCYDCGHARDQHRTGGACKFIMGTPGERAMEPCPCSGYTIAAWVRPKTQEQAPSVEAAESPAECWMVIEYPGFSSTESGALAAASHRVWAPDTRLYLLQVRIVSSGIVTQGIKWVRQEANNEHDGEPSADHHPIGGAR